MLVGEEVKICQSGYSRLDFLEIDTTRAGTVFKNTKNWRQSSVIHLIIFTGVAENVFWVYDAFEWLLVCLV